MPISFDYLIQALTYKSSADRTPKAFSHTIKSSDEQAPQGFSLIDDHTGKNSGEQTPQAFSFAHEQANFGYMAMMSVFFSDLGGIAKYLKLWSHYFFPISFGIKVADMLFVFWKFLRSSNKNANKLANTVWKATMAGVFGIGVFGAAVLSVSAPPIIFAAVAVADVLLSVGKALFFALGAIGEEPHVKAYYNKEAKENGIRAATGVVMLAGLAAALIFAPYVAPIIVGVAAITAAAALVVWSIFSIVERVRENNKIQSIKNGTISIEEYNANKAEPLLSPHRISRRLGIPIAKPENNKKSQSIAAQQGADNSFVVSKDKYSNFFANRAELLKPVLNPDADLKHLKDLIEKHIEKIQLEIEQSKHSLIEKIWSQQSKRENKLQALNALKEFINKFDDILNDENDGFKEIRINKAVCKKYHYRNVYHLIFKFDQDITRHCAGAYQSFFKDVGGVEALFKQAYKLLITKANRNKIAKANMINAEENVNDVVKENADDVASANTNKELSFGKPADSSSANPPRIWGRPRAAA